MNAGTHKPPPCFSIELELPREEPLLSPLSPFSSLPSPSTSPPPPGEPSTSTFTSPRAVDRLLFDSAFIALLNCKFANRHARTHARTHASASPAPPDPYLSSPTPTPANSHTHTDTTSASRHPPRHNTTRHDHCRPRLASPRLCYRRTSHFIRPTHQNKSAEQRYPPGQPPPPLEPTSTTSVVHGTCAQPCLA